MDAIEFLREDHRKVLAMLDRLQAAPAARDGASDELLEARKSLVTEIVIAESQHEAVEEQYFWPMVRKEVPGGEGLAGPAVDQEAAAKYLLDALDKAAANQSDFDEMVERLLHDGRKHIRYEQDEVWPEVRAAVGADRLGEVGEQMAAAKKKAPTRPHPGTPPAPAVQKIMGRAAGLIDRLRDGISGRGE
ncbi:hemerythrin domain-containing protein [Amycolatopsis acidiphila]|uniref:Hemerythrin domain-containing protein n=1 Tax=Amycolatopsis acidiphila TaxID=715473 RepID=A0A558AB44_9PSEU|nr:hemerythrin domain-containing protein [Amycolatopsis acidiphila]TVT21489.1 hemerythrin domain-containing protein [Amycolatopsis acidiphila]UIJ63173.1 hemerythrin domain-containing protein [Amycolatopsis acidiphila]GHG74188.1 hemerythrin [Amycolatopsis acidiphila]